MQVVLPVALAIVVAVSCVCAGPTPASSDKYTLSYGKKLTANFKPLKENALLSFVIGMPSGNDHKNTIIYNVVGHKDGNAGIVVLTTGDLANWLDLDARRNTSAMGESSEELIKDLERNAKGGKSDDDSSEEDLLRDHFDDFMDMIKDLNTIEFHKDNMKGGAKKILEQYGWTHPFVSTTAVQVSGFLDGGMGSDNLKWDPLDREYQFELYSKNNHLHFELVGGNKTQSDLLELDLEDEDKNEEHGVWISVRNPEEGTVTVTGPTPL